MKRCLMLLMVLAVLSGGAGCARHAGENGETGGYVLYFPVDSEEAASGPALDTQPYEGEELPGVETLMNALLAGPTRQELISPFPRNVSLTDWEWKEGGIVHLTLSEQYSGLADISLTLADYCIVLTLGQLEGVEGVEIQSANYRSHQLLCPEEAELQPPDTMGT